MPIQCQIHHHYTFTDQLICVICREPVDLRTAKADGDAKAVHKECCVQKTIRAEPNRR